MSPPNISRPATRGERPARDAFTLVEMLVVMGIMAVLVTLAVPALSKALQSGREGKSVGNMRAVSAMINSYVAESGGFYPEDSNPPYCNRLFNYLDPAQTNSLPAAESNARLAGTVFVSPFMTMEILKKYNYDNSFSGQYVLRQVYGINGRLSMTNGINRRASALARPSTTCLLMSSVGPRADTAGNVVDVGAEALNGYLQVVFADGHLEKLPRAQVPTNVLSVGTNNYNRLFWIGLE